MEKVKSLPSKLSLGNRFIKRFFDVIVSFVGLLFAFPIIIISAMLVRIKYKESGFFTQTRVGKDGREFKIVKIKTMSSRVNFDTTVTTTNDPRITELGKIFRKTKMSCLNL